MEQWRAIKGYEGLYEVSDYGRVRSLDREDSIGRKRTGKVLSCASSSGYLFVNLSKDGTQTVFRVHPLVAETFLGECPDGHQINHKDCNKGNNHADNLEYVTHKENIQHAARNGRMGKLSPAQVRAIRAAVARDRTVSLELLANALGVHMVTVSNIVKARSRTYISNPDGSTPVPLKTHLTVEDITSMQAQGYTLPEIGRYYGVEYSTPYQILRRAKLRQQRQQD